MLSTKLRLAVILSALVVVPQALTQEGKQQFASLGDFKLESGEILRDCQLGYRTFGQLNADKSNVILFPTWFNGTTAQLAENFAPGKLVDTSKYYVIAVDALANGISTSPSNSTQQPRMRFPKITIRDMVNSEHKLLTENLQINHVKAVMGISMGGMQTFQWIVSYPGFMEKAIPIVGSPRLAPYDILLWQSENDAIMRDPAWNNGDYQQNPALIALAEIGGLVATTPQDYNRHKKRAEVAASIEKSKTEPAADANNHIRQAEAMMGLDVSDAFGGSLDQAAAAVKARVLVVVSRQDHMVTPEPALDFAKRMHAEVLELNADCGHLLLDCESGKVVPAVSAFLAK